MMLKNKNNFSKNFENESKDDDFYVDVLLLKKTL